MALGTGLSFHFGDSPCRGDLLHGSAENHWPNFWLSRAGRALWASAVGLL